MLSLVIDVMIVFLESEKAKIIYRLTTFLIMGLVLVCCQNNHVTVLDCVLRHMSIVLSSNLGNSELWPFETMTPVYHGSFLGPLLTDTDHSRSRTPHISCSLELRHPHNLALVKLKSLPPASISSPFNMNFRAKTSNKTYTLTGAIIRTSSELLTSCYARLVSNTKIKLSWFGPVLSPV